MEPPPTASRFLVLAILVAAAAAASSASEEVLARDADFIDELPNQPDGTDFRQYSGYVVAEPLNKRQYFYYFAEAEGRNPLSKPLIAYIGTHDPTRHGSALLPAFEQVGPFSVGDDGQTLLANPFSWNKLANLLFIEGPIGVGFAKSDNGQDIYGGNDYYFLSETYQFLVNWMKRFPEYNSSNLYLAGQGYMGVFGTGLVSYILYKNSRPGNPHINIEGIMVGNPRLDDDLEFFTKIESEFRMNEVSEELVQEYRKVCNFDKPDEFMTCWQPLGEVEKLRLTLNDFNIYAKFCPNVDPNAVGLDTVGYMLYECYEECVTGYLNIPFVQMMMHVEATEWGPIMWQPFSGSKMLSRNFTTARFHMKAAMTKGVRILIYSGVLDTTTVIPDLVTIKTMNLTISSEWRPWFDNTVQLAGFTESYVGGLTYATIRGAGGKAMADQPERGFILAKSFLTNTALPFTNFTSI